MEIFQLLRKPCKLGSVESVSEYCGHSLCDHILMGALLARICAEATALLLLLFHVSLMHAACFFSVQSISMSQSLTQLHTHLCRHGPLRPMMCSYVGYAI